VSADRTWSAGRAVRAWLTSRLFARQLIDFLLLWMAFKAVNAGTALNAGLAPLAFRPWAEAAALGFECGALLVFLRGARERVLLANLGLDVPLVLLPFFLLHVAMSLGVAALA
jgi:hypothetical protein